MFFRNIGPFELMIVLAIVVLLFGVGRLGELGASLGKGIRNFKREVSAKDEPAEETPPKS